MSLRDILDAVGEAKRAVFRAQDAAADAAAAVPADVDGELADARRALERADNSVRWALDVRRGL